MTATTSPNGTANGVQTVDTPPDLEQRLASMEAELPLLLASIKEMTALVVEMTAEVRSLPRKDGGVD